MSTIPSESSDPYGEQEREFLQLTLYRQIFGAIYDALAARKRDLGLTRDEFGSRIGREKTGVSKLLNGPGNWTLKTLSDVSNALDLDIRIAFIDRHNPSRRFTPFGQQFVATQAASSVVNGSFNVSNADRQSRRAHGQIEMLNMQLRR